MACKDKRKVWTDVKGHERRVLKCQNKAKNKKPRKKRPARKRAARPIVESPEPGPHKKISSVKITFVDDAVDDIKRIREFKVRPARKYASTWPGYY